MGSGKSSLVLRFVKSQFFDYQVSLCTGSCLGRTILLCAFHVRSDTQHQGHRGNIGCSWAMSQESTIGAAFLTKTLPEQHVKFEIWCARAAACFYRACPC